MIIKRKNKSYPDVVDYFKELPSYNKHIEKSIIKLLKNIDLISELPRVCNKLQSWNNWDKRSN